ILYEACLTNNTGTDLSNIGFSPEIDPNTTQTTFSGGRDFLITPIAADDNYSPARNTTFNSPAPGVMVNDFDPDDATAVADGRLPVTSFSSVGGDVAGPLTINPNGSFTYNAPDSAGTDIWQYTITDADGLTNPVPGYITFNVQPFEPESLPPVANLLTQGQL